MIPIRCKAISGVALSTIDGETKLLVMKRVKGGFWCHVAGTVEAGEAFELLPGPRQVGIAQRFAAKMFKHMR